jgi:DNA-binding NtrC family response regulator
VLLILDGRYDELEHALRLAGYTVVIPSTPDQAVAVSQQNQIAATLIDAGSFQDCGDWSLAQSLKAVAPFTPVLLVVPDSDSQMDIPPGVDIVVSAEDPQRVLNALRIRKLIAAKAG